MHTETVLTRKMSVSAICWNTSGYPVKLLTSVFVLCAKTKSPQKTTLGCFWCKSASHMMTTGPKRLKLNSKTLYWACPTSGNTEKLFAVHDKQTKKNPFCWSFVRNTKRKQNHIYLQQQKTSQGTFKTTHIYILPASDLMWFAWMMTVLFLVAVAEGSVMLLTPPHKSLRSEGWGGDLHNLTSTVQTATHVLPAGSSRVWFLLNVKWNPQTFAKQL